MKKVIAFMIAGLLVVSLLIGFAVFHPVETIKTAEVVKVDETGTEYQYIEYEGYNVFGYRCCHSEMTTW